MRRHVKASSAGSNSGQGKSHGASLRGAFTIRGISGESGGSGVPSHRSCAQRFVLLCLALTLIVACTATPALAVKTHPSTGVSFGPEGTAGTNFFNLQGVAVDQVSGNVYAYDAGAGKIYKFDSAGNPINFSALAGNAIEGVGGAGAGEEELAVAPAGAPGGTAGDIYAANNSVVKIYAPSGAVLGELSGIGETCGVATNSAGHVFVGIYPTTVREYTPVANPVTNADQSGVSTATLPGICNVAADGLGTVYAANYGGSDIAELEGISDTSPTSITPGASTLAIDPANDDLYADRGTEVAQYDSAGTLLGTFGSGLTNSHGIAVNGAAEEIYVGNGGRVDVFGPSAIVPGTSAQAADAITGTKATLHGIVNPDGFAVTNCEFEYGTSTGYGSTTPCAGAIPTDSSDHPVTAALTGLTPGLTYHFRLAAANANGGNRSGDQSFETAQPAITKDATAIGGAKATLNGVVLPEGETVSECFFEYGGVGAFDKTVPCAGAIPADEGEHAVTAALTHLVPNGTQYNFRLVINRGGIVHGASKTFNTAETVVTGSAGAISPPTATIEGTIDPEGILLAECKFEYGHTFEYGSTISCAESPAAIGEGTVPVSVHADLSGLAFEATYHYRLVATNADGTAKGKDEGFQTPGTPLIEADYVDGVTDTEAQPRAKINPAGLPTTYHLEYGATASYGQSTQDAVVGADHSGHTLIGLLEGLTPDTAYHWRVVASNSHGVSNGLDHTFVTFPTFVAETDCPNQGLRSGASAILSDCRAYEMVSPPQKAGEVFPPESLFGGSCGECLPGVNGQKQPMQSALDGETVLYEGQPFAAGLATIRNDYLARRTSSGWVTQGINSAFANGRYRGFSPDLASGVLYQDGPALSPEAPTREGKAFVNLYLRSEDGSMQPLVTVEPPNRGPGREDFRIVYAGANSGTAAAPAFSHLAFEANDALTAATADAPAVPDPGAGENYDLYEWAGGQLRLVNVLPGNAAVVPGAVIGSGRQLAVTDFSREGANVDHAISADGSRIFWSDEGGQVYVRIDGKETKEFKDHSGKFLTASADGSRALLSDGCLYDLASEACEEDLTAGLGGFQGILGSGEDLSHIYFVDTKALTPPGEENANHEHAEAEEPNLYAWHDGDTAFIGVLRAIDNAGFTDAGDWRAARASRSAQVSFDGRYLAFMSQAPLTGYDNIQISGATRCSGGNGLDPGFPCFEVFEYDAATAILSCASCNPTKQQPLGGSSLSLIRAGNIFPPFRQPGNLSADGQGRLFFESQDTLSLRDKNGRIQDVYEWEPNGVGSCKRTAGCISLISSGQSVNDSMFLDSTPSGDDAFFITREQLLLRDKDGQLDLYDARAGGGISENTPPPCLGEACKGASSSAPEQAGPGSSTFSGPGNEKPKHHKHKKRRKHSHKHKTQKQSAKHKTGGSK